MASKKVFRKTGKTNHQLSVRGWRGKSPSEREVLQMQDAMREEKPATEERATDEELYEVLVAISVVARQLAKKVIQKGENNEQDERTGHGA